MLQWLAQRGASLREIPAGAGSRRAAHVSPPSARTRCKELRQAFGRADPAPHVTSLRRHARCGRPAGGDAGFADPVMDMETITLTYADAERAWWGICARYRRAAIGPPGRRRGARPAAHCGSGVREAYEQLRARRPAAGDLRGDLRPCVEATAAPRAKTRGRAIVRFDPGRGRSLGRP
ncbi:MAG: hypothetical protein MZW92_05150 [Comamonadaceae bacterium]|nr:hypothetical protein [Comamonadaceae bacterium]